MNKLNKKILWVEDESYTIQGLFKPLIAMGIEVVEAKCAIEAFNMAQNWQSYDMIAIDLIIPLMNDDEDLPDVVAGWDEEPYVGIGLAKWLVTDLKVECPILLLSVIDNPIKVYNLSEYGLTHYLSKSGLLPSVVKKDVLSILGVGDEQ